MNVTNILVFNAASHTLRSHERVQEARSRAGRKGKPLMMVAPADVTGGRGIPYMMYISNMI